MMEPQAVCKFKDILVEICIWEEGKGEGSLLLKWQLNSYYLRERSALKASMSHSTAMTVNVITRIKM